MYLCILLISARLANVKTKSIVEADHSGKVSQETNFFNESEIPLALTVSDQKCEGLCSENLLKAVTQCKKGQGLVPAGVIDDAYCKDCECRNDNNCTFTKGFFGNVTKKCECEAGYEEKNGVCIGTCNKNPCQNEGGCAVVAQDIKCNCKGQFTGNRCENKLVTCSSMFTKCTETNGQCVNEGVDEKCVCAEDATYVEGVGCTVVCPNDLEECSSTTGFCIREKYSNRVKCVCPKGTEYLPGYGCTEFSNTTSGILLTATETTDLPNTESTTDLPNNVITTDLTDTVTTPDLLSTEATITNSPDTDSTTVVIDLCVIKPCKNGGICKMEGENYVCYCSSPFTGKYCEMDPCSNNPCRNGGTCFVNGVSFQCICREPFAGNTCEANPCMWNPCKNGGICKLVNKSARCFCDNSYSGEFCEYVKGTGLTLIMLIVISALLIIILVVLSCYLCQRIHGSETS